MIKTIQNCFGITEELTPRAAAAPDLSGVLTLTEPRTSDIPIVTAPTYEQKT